MKIDQQAGNTKKIQASTVMSLPSTRGGTLLKKMRGNEPQMVDMTGFRVSYTELAGVKLGRIFTPNLSKGQPCGRESCQPCTKNDPDKIQNCRTRSILYQSACSLCNPPGRKDEKSSHKVDDPFPTIREGIYYGESSRSLAERAAEHYRDARKFDKGSHMVKHWIEKHPEMNELPPFTITILRSFKDCLTRQVSEAVTMYLSRDRLLNSKNEYVQNCISRVTVEEDKYQRKIRERQEEQEELENAEKLDRFKKEKEQVQDLDWKRNPENFPDGWRAKKRRVNLNPTDNEATGCSPGLGENNKNINDHILEDFMTWWSWATEECQRAGRVEQLRMRMQKEKEAIIKWMDAKKHDNNFVQPTVHQTARNNHLLSFQMNNKAAKDKEMPRAPRAPMEDQDLVRWWTMAEEDARRTGRLLKAATEQEILRSKVAKKSEERENRLLVASMRQIEARSRNEEMTADDDWLYRAEDLQSGPHDFEPMEIDFDQADQEVEKPRGRKRKFEDVIQGEIQLEYNFAKKIKLEGGEMNQIPKISTISILNRQTEPLIEVPASNLSQLSRRIMLED